MEVWTFINKVNNELIRIDTRIGDTEFGSEYYLTTNKNFPLWFVLTEEDAKLAYNEDVHPKYSSCYYERPSTNRINIKDYEIISFKKEIK